MIYSAKKRIAVFDVDRTLIRGTSAEIQLIRFLRESGLLPFSNYMSMFFGGIKRLPYGFNEAFLRNKLYLNGISTETISSLIPHFFEERIRPRISKKATDMMHELKKDGHEILLISGTLDFILEFLVKNIGADGGVGSRMEVVDGKYTGRIIGPFPYYHDKVSTLQDYYRDVKIDYRNSFAFADSWADVPLLSKFGNPVAMNPGKILEIIARTRGWKIIKDND